MNVVYDESESPIEKITTIDNVTTMPCILFWTVLHAIKRSEFIDFEIN